MEPIPLIPAINSLSCPDTSHILREEFQDFLGKNKFSEKISENLHDFNSNELQLKTCGTEVVYSYNEMKTKAQELTYAEKLVMAAQAEYLTHAQEPKKDGAPFKLDKVYPDLDENIVEKYSLLQTDDIMPHITERIINCKMKPHEFLFKNACLETKRNLNKLANLECLGNCKNEQKCQLKISSSQENKLAKLEIHHKIRNKERHKYSYTNKEVFNAEPKELIFSNYETNIVYKQQLRLRNVTLNPQTFKYPILSKNSKFSVKQHGDQYKIAPGMCAVFTVSFTSCDLSDSFNDVLIFRVPGSQSIHVKLYSWRDVPHVKGLIYQEEEGLFDEITTPREKDNVFNYTIDCGAVLYGCSKEMKFIVQNCGGHGVFFLLSEEDWVYGEVNNITEDFKLELQDFSLSPAYFELKENEVNEIKIHFTPTQYGLCLDKLFLLCDSNTVEEIDIIGDCLFYEPYFLKFQMPECPFSPYKRSSEPKNILHLGAIYSKQSVSGIFSIHNTSTLSFTYEWRKTKYRRSQDFIPIDSNCIEIFPSQGIFPPVSETEFDVTVRMEHNNFGLFKYAYSLYVLDIMEKNLSEGPIFTFGEEYRNETFEKCLTVQVDKIEVQIHHIPLQIHIYPEDIHFPTLFYKEKSCLKTIRVVNNGFCCMFCEWIHDKGCGCQKDSKDQVQITPIKFDLEANTSVDCSISLIPSSYDDIYETFVLSINRGYAAYTLPIHALVEKPHIQVSHTFLDFGSLVKRDSDVHTVLYVENESDVPLYWQVYEYRYRFETGRFEEVCACALNANCGVLCHKGSGTKLEYKLDTSIVQRFVSILVFYTIYKSQLYESNHVILIANIVQPVIKILNENYKEEIFSIYEEYFVQETITRTFYIHNDSSLEVEYSWGEPTGDNISHVSITFPTWCGRLFPWSRLCIKVTLTFLQPGVLSDVYVPLGIEALSDPYPPLALQICCRVKPPQIIVSIPVESDCRTTKYVDVLWPLYRSEDVSELVMMGEDEGSQIQECLLMPEWESSRRSCTIINLMNAEPEETSNLLYYPDDIFSYLKSIEMPDKEDYHYPSEVSLTVCDDINTAEVGRYKKSCERLTSVFGSNTSICEYLIEFRDIPCRKLCKKSIEITNIMDVPTKFSITVKNFKSKPLCRKKLDNILININWKTDDKYAKQLSEYGIVVIVDPETSDLTNKSTVIIELQVYAETWGFYLEELAIEVENLPIFYINVFIQVIGFPIEFPMNTNTLNTVELNENVIRFGPRSICSKIETRTIYFKNNCTIPYTVVWHIFVKNIEDYLKGSVNIAYDIFGFGSEDKSINCKLRVMSYFGKESSRILDLFKIEPHETYIKPKETKSLHVSLNPEYFSSDIDYINIEALLIGNIYIEDQYQIVKNESNFVIRHPEKELDSIKFYLTADIEPGEIDLNCIHGERHVKVAVSDFLLEDQVVMANLRLVFRNTASYTVVIGLKIGVPFRVVSVKSAANETTQADRNNMYTTVVHSDCCAEVIVQCLVNTDMLMILADVIYKGMPHYLNDVTIFENNQVKVTKNLYIYQKCDIKQMIPLSMTMAFPWTVVSVEILEFGQVRLGTEKKLTVKLLNKTACNTWFHATLTNDLVFQCSPSSGYLSPALSEDYSAYLTVTFTPKDIGDYEDNLLVVTCVSQYQQEVRLTGTGTFNEKYMYDVSTN